MRALRPDEIEVRIGTINSKGVTLLLYKNARVDMQILDETYGQFGWQDDYKELKGNMYCGIGVYDNTTGYWVWKWDCGTESNTEKEKGEASDAFKRAGFRWGIGRELYTSPRLQLNLDTRKKERGGYELVDPWAVYDVFVSKIRTEEENGKLIIKAVELSKKEFDKIYPIGIFPKGARI